MSQESGRYAYDGLERVIHEKARLGILTSLLTHPEGILFNDLKALCALTDGNLSRHLKVLEEEGLVDINKSFQNNRPQTACSLTPTGRERFLAYLQALEKVIKDAELATQQTKAVNGKIITA
ncbi:putative transcriptional regulator [Beggiatoa alba B18LD]|uniref:Putative transcriptional regulator n=1 Tax=Beggiatoa alba B18LD TaxID=395493 RepID=I3CC81_9GAMM|nr:transcriptional regulator [Beggiatoa alba]EIJ41224.1 putative transcriptional regulator [Beggiatoa alba B18LD]